MAKFLCNVWLLLFLFFWCNGVSCPSVEISGWQSAGTWLDRRNAGWDQAGCGWGKYRQLGRQPLAFCQLSLAIASELFVRLLPANCQRYTERFFLRMNDIWRFDFK